MRNLRIITDSERTPELVRKAYQILSQYRNYPYGTEVPFQIDGIEYLAIVEQHYHKPGGSIKPYGYHPGVTVYTYNL
jgi:hypothetical protein